MALPLLPMMVGAAANGSGTSYDAGASVPNSVMPQYAQWATGSTLEVGGGGTYALTEAGLNDAIDHANNGDTIKFVSSGTITLTNDIVIDKSITLDMNDQTVGLQFSLNF